MQSDLKYRMEEDSHGSNTPTQWTIVFRNPSHSLVLYNSRSQEVRTVERSQSPTMIQSTWAQENYFEILAKILIGNRTLPPSLHDYLMNGYFNKFFPIREKIGSGGVGSVYKVEHQLAGINLATYAVKVVPVGEFSWLRKAVFEVQLLEKLGQTPHPLVLGYKHCWIEDWQPAKFGPKVPCLFILMEYAPYGSVDGYLKKNPHLSLDEKWQIFCSIAVGLWHLHSLSILHCDLKLSNVLIFDDPSNNLPLPYRFAISDFGTAVELSSQETYTRTRTGATGTIETMAPELLLVDLSGEYTYRHSYASDIWSLGTILFALFFGVQPFGDDSGENRLRNFTDLNSLISDLKLEEKAKTIPPTVLEILDQTLRAKSSERISINDLLHNQFIYSKIKQFGFKRFVDDQYNNNNETNISRVVVVSPSLEEINSSLLALPFSSEENHPDFLKNENNSEMISFPNKTLENSKTYVQKIWKLNSDVFLLLLSLLSIKCNGSSYEYIHIFLSILICSFCMIKPTFSLLAPIFVAIECLSKKSNPPFFLIILIIIMSIMVQSV